MTTKLRGRFSRSSSTEQHQDKDGAKDAVMGSTGQAQVPMFLRVSSVQGSELEPKDGP